jgi:hypothetical protein
MRQTEMEKKERGEERRKRKRKRSLYEYMMARAFCNRQM